MIRHVNPDGSLGGLHDTVLAPNVYTLHEDVIYQHVIIAHKYEKYRKMRLRDIRAKVRNELKQLRLKTHSEYAFYTKMFQLNSDFHL